MSITELQTNVMPTQPEGKFKLLSTGALMEFPDPEWLIDEMVEVGSLAVLYGPSKSAKSFTALDWSLSIAAGHTWKNHEVKKGNVVYVVGEGSRGIKRRVAAWCQVAGVNSVDGAFFVMQAPKLLNNSSDLHDLIAEIKATSEKVAMVVIDTLATSFVGGDENQSKDMGDFINACRRFPTDLGATVLLVHHTGKGKNAQDIERGSSALRGAADVMVLQRMDKDRVVTIRNTKQKDDEEFAEIKLQLTAVSLEALPAQPGKKVPTSCVLFDVKSAAPPPPQVPSFTVPALTQSERTALKELVKFGPMSVNEWRHAVTEAKGEDLSLKTFQNWRHSLIEKGCIESVPGKVHHYQVTVQGSAIVNGTGQKVA
jgi:hypothetical protein